MQVTGIHRGHRVHHCSLVTGMTVDCSLGQGSHLITGVTLQQLLTEFDHHSSVTTSGIGVESRVHVPKLNRPANIPTASKNLN